MKKNWGALKPYLNTFRRSISFEGFDFVNSQFLHFFYGRVPSVGFRQNFMDLIFA